MMLLVPQVFGHRDVSVLDGGLPRWKSREFPLSHGLPPTVVPSVYHSSYNPNLVRTFQQMMSNFSSREEQVRCVLFELSCADSSILHEPCASQILSVVALVLSLVQYNYMYVLFSHWLESENVTSVLLRIL